jgi:Eukaryotic protein of unknown function (DUF953)
MEGLYTKSHVNTFNTDITKFMEANTTFLALFKGAEDENGVNWCSDCVRAEPTINNVLYPLAKQNNIPVIYCNAGTRDE